MADGFTANLLRWARVRLEVGHGMDARHSFVLLARSDSSAVSPQSANVPDALWVLRKFRSAALARRGCAWQRINRRQNAGRRMAEIRESATALWVYVRAARQEAIVHGG